MHLHLLKLLTHIKTKSKMNSSSIDLIPNNVKQKYEHEPNVCAPICNVFELYGFVDNPPEWIKDIEDIKTRSSTVVANSKMLCHYLSGNANVPERLDSKLVPRTLVCHDMKNGYLADKFTGGVAHECGYTFYRWSQIDMFVYFSHHFITIPPLAWINVAHGNGVKILGTLITEWDEGKKLCGQFLKDMESMKSFVHALLDITVMYKLDGWLLNFENALENTSMLLEFVRYLTKSLHNRKEGSVIIWYDSIIIDGTLKWQNELNAKNRCFFDVCDGIFLNYTWKDENILVTSKVAQYRAMDVYVGIDVFGRNTYGGGKFNCHVAAEKIRSLNMSMAIFGQGWTHETLEKEPWDTFFERFVTKDNTFWRSLWPYLYTHPIKELFHTSFYIGTDKVNYNLHKQQLQLSRFLHSNTSSSYDITVPTLKDQCNCLQLHMEEDKTYCLLSKESDGLFYTHHLLTCDIYVQGDIILYVFTKAASGQRSDFLNIILLIQEDYAFKKIICSAILREKPDSNSTITTINPLQDNRIVNFDSNDDIPKKATLRCYHIKFPNVCRILDISGEIEMNCSSLILCGIGMKKANIKDV